MVQSSKQLTAFCNPPPAFNMRNSQYQNQMHQSNFRPKSKAKWLLPRRCFIIARIDPSKPPSDDKLQTFIQNVSEAYTNLRPHQQLYIQVLYITFVVTIMLSVSASLVRIYHTLTMTTGLLPFN